MQSLLDKTKLDVDIVRSTKEENDILSRLGEDYKPYSEMIQLEREFLNSMVLRKQPKKILEIGVSKGASSLIILNAIKDIPDAHLYSIDYMEYNYNLRDKRNGFIVDNYPELKEKWTLNLGGFALNYLDEIGGDIDLCFIDTTHCMPGELWDFLMSLPYLKKDALVVFHDTNLHILTHHGDVSDQLTTNTLMSAITGDKIIPDTTQKNDYETYINNIGAIQLNEQSSKNVYEIFNLLTHVWSYNPTETDISQFKDFIKRHYNEYYSNYLEQVINRQLNFKADVEKWNLLHKPAPVVNVNKKLSFWENIFSITNQKSKSGKHKCITLLGIKLKIKNGGGSLKALQNNRFTVYIPCLDFAYA